MTFQYHAHASQLASRAFSFLSSKSDFACLQWYRWFVLPKSRPTLDISHWTTTKITDFYEDCFQSLHPLWVPTRQLRRDHDISWKTAMLLQVARAATGPTFCVPEWPNGGWVHCQNLGNKKQSVDPDGLCNRLVQIKIAQPSQRRGVACSAPPRCFWRALKSGPEGNNFGQKLSPNTGWFLRRNTIYLCEILRDVLKFWGFPTNLEFSGTDSPASTKRRLTPSNQLIPTAGPATETSHSDSSELSSFLMLFAAPGIWSAAGWKLQPATTELRGFSIFTLFCTFLAIPCWSCLAREMCEMYAVDSGTSWVGFCGKSANDLSQRQVLRF